ncbi:nose resistant to fluoxetine protein 6 [Bactrocera neohumeralis]|uniref:nose resistant to fluoxetine protein 6 n=1 Tax=Bactrocera tryoni TaxID=59916 RepID=UPI001A99B1A1|nr:nose resistant to fluoxetine protein 6 [Bactrocera tryoni]XP_050331579.1 nose resistant to fluoxetine protein 6 [Bactrocera neohumeralis]
MAARHSFAALSLLIAVFAHNCYAEESTVLAVSGSPFKNDLAYMFYKEGSQIGAETLNATLRAYDDSKCLRDIDRISQALDEYYEWAIEFPDTWGRLPVGLMWGHALSFGAYEECLAASWQFSEDDVLRGQYCLARVPIKKYMDEIKPRESTVQARISYKYQKPEVFELGICIPSSCSAELGNQILTGVMNKYYDAGITSTMIAEKYCKYEQPVKLRGIDIFAIVFFSFIVFCMLASSVYDYIKTKNNEPKKPLFIAFSVLTNAPKIFTVKKSNNPNVIQCLNGLRCFSMMWVVFGHGYMTFYELPHINKDKVYTWIETPYSMLVQNATLCVDTFFFMSGLLMLWGAFREMERTKGKLNLGMMYFHRYIRLTPVVAVVILYIMSLYKYSGHGPMWMKIGTQDERCSDTWWATLLYVQNYAFPKKICISQSWYLAVDTQLYVLSPLILIPLWKWGKKALAPIILLGVLCMAGTFATFMVWKFTLFRVDDDHVDDRQRWTYYPTHTRVPTWLIGVIFGYFLYTKNRGRQIPLAKKWVITGWVLAFGVMLTDMWGPYWRILPENPSAPIIEGAFYEPLSRASWAIAIGWIVWACYNGHGGIINDFLSWGFFTGFSRLTYCMYVIHRIVQLVNGGRIQTDTHFGDYEMVLRWWHDFGISLTLSIFATLAFEAPILGIEKAIFGHGESKPAPKKIEPTSAPTTAEKTDTEVTVEVAKA